MLYQSINPYTEETLKTFDLHSDAQLASIVAKADNTYKNNWRRKTYAQRAAILHKAAEIMRHNRDAFATPITVEMGKLFREAQAEVDLSADILDYYADNAEKFLAPVDLKVDDGKATVLSQPIGIVFCIEPWNFPYYQLARVAGPNLMAGNVLIVKHAPGVPQCAVMFEELFADAGAPEGTYSNVFITRFC
ncbi:aldehyde dehydrogenase family protein [Komagataeibacter saccharivorans]|uniref:aldehyde dehydrogenase family protein n=1 Tax=Komagataeibacter saccharivorans TaxID=265959 RepID=UPI0039E74745